MRNLVRSPYFKAAATFLVSGGVLILFLNWVNATDFAGAIAKLNSTLLPVYIGFFIAFIMCPVYNKIVNVAYKYFTGRAGTEGKGEFLKKEVKRKKKHDAAYEAELDHDHKVKGRILNLSRVISSIAVVLLIVGLLFLLAYFVLPQIVSNVILLINTMPARMEAFSRWSAEHLSRFPQIQETINTIANSGSAEIIAWVQEHVLKQTGGAMSIAQIISSGVLSVVSWVSDIVIGLLISIYLLNYKEWLFAIGRKFINSTCSEKRASGIFEFVSVLNDTFISFLVGRILDAIIIGIITFIALTVSGIKMALLISVIVGVTNVIPFFGPFLGAIPSFLLVLMDSPIKALWFLVIIVVIQQLDGNVIGPKVVGNAIGLSSFWVLLAVLIGGGLFGILGMLLGAPVFAVFYKYADRGMRKRLHAKDKPVGTHNYYNLDSYEIDKTEIYGED